MHIQHLYIPQFPSQFMNSTSQGIQAIGYFYLNIFGILS